MKKYIRILIVVLTIIIAVFAVSFYVLPKEKHFNNLNNATNSTIKPSEDKNKPIGGERDSHGCLGPAGYSWNQTIGACIREWELNEAQRKASIIAVAPLSYYVTITNVEPENCTGCYKIEYSTNDNQEFIIVNLTNWKISQ